MNNFPSSHNYLDSNIMWIGDYPSRWNLTQVKYEAYVKARVGWHGLKSDDFTDEGAYLVTGSDFKSTSISWQDCYHCDMKRYEQDPYIQIKNGDLLITKDGTIGKVALVQQLAKNEKATLNSGIFVVRPLDSNFLSKFYFWLLQSRVFTDFVDYNKTGSTIVHLYQDTFVNFSYASPKLHEQTQIAAFLDHETAKIDTLIDKQQQLIELLKEKRQAVISRAVTKGLDPDVPMKDSGVEWLGEIPEFWRINKMRYMFSFGKGLTITKDNLVDEGIPCVNYGEVHSKFSFEVDPKRHVLKCVNANYLITSSNSLLNKGDLVFADTSEDIEGSGNFTQLVSDDTVFAGYHTIIARPHDSKYSRFYAYLFDCSELRSQIKYSVKGVKVFSITQAILRAINIWLPSPEEQTQIAAFLDHETAKIDKLIDLQLQQIELLKERRTALISAAVTGKIDVRDWQTTVMQTESDEVMA